ncbi:Uncharacterised protein r2_g2959 [Pycnogonum litorale]
MIIYCRCWKMIRIALLVCIVVCACASSQLNQNEEWTLYKKAYNKKYEGKEDVRKMKVFMDNVKFIEEHNKKYEANQVSFGVRVNEYADMTTEEFVKVMKGYKPSNKTRTGSSFVPPSNVDLTAAVDRRTKGLDTPVKNQQQCGSCWPFSSTGSLEGQHKTKTGEHVSLSEQNIVDCSGKYVFFPLVFCQDVTSILLHYLITSPFAGYRSSVGPPPNVDLPATVDWRQKGLVTPVKNQQLCGSCWAFSSTGSLEGQHKTKTGKLVSLSEQNLVDCSGKYGNNGCEGGTMDNSFRYVKANDGIDTERSYPYEAKDDVCRFKKKMSVPPSLDIRGVYDEPQCSQVQLDHGVLVVGYGTDGSSDYWLVKNSWDTGWGMSGYIKMSRNKKNQCGISTAASYPLV